MNEIKTKEDAKRFLEKIKNCKVFTFYNEGISMQGHGTTDYAWEGENFSSYNFGIGWEDQRKAYFDEDEFLAIIWSERKYINKALKTKNYRFI